jgi:hypothetical protein
VSSLPPREGCLRLLISLQAPLDHRPQLDELLGPWAASETVTKR